MGYRILVLDDMPQHIEALRMAAHEGGHEIISRRTVADAMMWLNTRDHVDVIVSATHLEDESVFEFLNKVKSNPCHNWVQFVMLSTNTSDLAIFLDETLRHTAKLLGADKYVVMREFCPWRLLKEIEASFPAMPPQKEQDPIRDALYIPRPASELPDNGR